MNKQERERYLQEVTDFRFKLVAELANPYLSSSERKAMIREKARVEHQVPGLGRRRLSEACILKWLSRYRSHGKQGLCPQDRRDSGVSRSFSPGEAAVFLNYLQEHPEVTATTALRTLKASGAISRAPSSSSVSRLVRSAGLERERRIQKHAEQKNLKFDFFAPLECVQADGMYTVKVPDEKGRLRQAVLLAFLDDATRRVLDAGFSFSENSLAFESGIKHILAAHGRIGRLYADHGSAFVGMQTTRILDTLGVVLVHSQVRRPQGRGKIERFFRTVRQQFFAALDATSINSLKDLQLRFHSWLDTEYHRSPHSGLEGRTPLEAWVHKAHLIIPLDPGIDLDQAFLHEAVRAVHKDSTLTLDGALFEVPSDLIGERISVRYDPHRPPRHRRLQILRGGQCIGEARLVDSYANTKVKRTDLAGQLEFCPPTPEDSFPQPPPRRAVDNSLSATHLSWDTVGPDDDENAAAMEVLR